MPFLEAFVCKQYKMHLALEGKLGHIEIFPYNASPKAQVTSDKIVRYFKHHFLTKWIG